MTISTDSICPVSFHYSIRPFWFTLSNIRKMIDFHVICCKIEGIHMHNALPKRVSVPQFYDIIIRRDEYISNHVHNMRGSSTDQTIRTLHTSFEKMALNCCCSFFFFFFFPPFFWLFSVKGNSLQTYNVAARPLFIRYKVIEQLGFPPFYTASRIHSNC